MITNYTALSHWVAFDFDKKETRPTEYGKYLICRKDGKIHWETWNGSGWAYNHKEIRYWAFIVHPLQAIDSKKYCTFCNTELAPAEYENPKEFFISCTEHRQLAQIETEKFFKQYPDFTKWNLIK